MSQEIYRFDIWHNWHLGAGRYFVSSALVILIPVFEGSSVPEKLRHMTQLWLKYCRERRTKPYLMKITKQTLNCDGPNEWPEGGWQKADTTRLLCEPWP